MLLMVPISRYMVLYSYILYLSKFILIYFDFKKLAIYFNQFCFQFVSSIYIENKILFNYVFNLILACNFCLIDFHICLLILFFYY